MIGIGNWLFDFSEPLVSGISLLLLFSLVWTLATVYRRLFQRSRLRAVSAMLLNVAAFVAVIILLLEPLHTHPGNRSVILLTEGTDYAQAVARDGASLYVSPGVAYTTGAKHLPGNANWLVDVAQLPLREPALDTIELAGYGLTEEEWLTFPDDIRVDFKPLPVNGFSGMRWQRTRLEGDALTISGYFRRENPEAVVEIRLLDPAFDIIDETRLVSGQSFSLAAPIKARGHLEYTLQAMIGDSLLSEQLVPVYVGSSPAMNIMVEQSAPSFETRYLKNYAAESGHRVTVNTQISRDKSITQTANLPDDTETTFSPHTLAMQDVLIMDGRALINLPDTRKQWLVDAIEKGLGLLVMADSALLEGFDALKINLLPGFHLSAVTNLETSVVPRSLADPARAWQDPQTAQPMKLSVDKGDVLIDDGPDRVLVAKTALGLGNIAISLLGHSHEWLSRGKRADWSGLWSSLISELARQPSKSVLLPQADTEFYRVSRRGSLCALSSEKDLVVSIRSADPDGNQATFELDLAADSLGSPRQCAYFWPHNDGWFQIQLLSGRHGPVLDHQAVYVFQAQQWLAQQRSERVYASRNKAANSASRAPVESLKQISEPVDVFWPWLILILSATILWLERKLDFG